MDDDSSYDVEAQADVRKSGFSTHHKLIFDFAPSSSELTYQYGHRMTWVGPTTLHNSMKENGYADPGLDSRAVYVFDFDQLPRPSWMSRLVGYDEAKMRVWIIGSASLRYPRIYRYLRRAPTQKEVDQMAAFEANAYTSITKYTAMAVGIALPWAFWTSRRGRWHMPLPFRMPRNYQRSSRFEVGTVKIPFTSRILLRGPAAVSLQTMFRASIYGLSAYIFSKAFVNSLLVTTELRAMQQPELRELRTAYETFINSQREEARDMVRNRRTAGHDEASQAQGNRLVQEGDFKRHDPTGQGSVAMTEKWRRHRNDIGAPESRRETYDDMSPAQDGFEDDMYAQPDVTGEERFVDDDPNVQRQNLGSPEPGDSADTVPGHPFQSGSASSSYGESSGSANDFFDDGNDNTENSSAKGQATNKMDQRSPGASAWDRVRRGVVPSRRSGQDQGGNGSTDGRSGSTIKGFPLSSAEQGREADKAQAQKDFDAMLEKERGGAETSSKGNRW